MEINEIKLISRRGLVIVNPKFAQTNNVFFLKETLLKFGLRAVEVKVKIDHNLPEGQLEISKNVIEGLMLPEFATYNIFVENKEIIIGPYIGILLATKKENLYRRSRVLAPYVRYYEKIGGAIVGFTVEDLNRNKLTVNGIVYNPTTRIWERMEVPYPSSIIKRGFVNTTNRQYLYSLYGEKFFNYKPINKWEMHKRLNQFDDIKRYLPESLLYEDKQNIIDFLNLHSDIYVKPVGGNQGKGIYNIVKENNEIKIGTRKDGENITYVCNTKKELEEFTSKYLQEKKYILQKTLKLSINNRVIDFRVGLDRNNKGLWQHNMFITRVGGDDSIVSNVATSGGYVDYPQNVLESLYELNANEAIKIEKDLLDIAYKIANKLDLTGVTLGKIALDLCLDKNLNIHLIEVNNRAPNDNLMKALDDYEKFYKIKLENIKYAKKLAGFEEGIHSYYQIKNKHESIELNSRLLVRLSQRQLKSLKQELVKFTYDNKLDYEITNDGYQLIISKIKMRNSIKSLIEFIKSETKGISHTIIVESANLNKRGKVFINKRKILNLERENLRLQEELSIYMKEVDNYKKSKSWRITAPLRKLSNFIKR